MMEVEKIVGKVKEQEKPEGEVIVGSSEEVLKLLSSCNIPFLLRKQVIFFFHTFPLLYKFPQFFFF